MIWNFIQNFEWTKFYSLKAGMHCMPCIHWRYAPAPLVSLAENAQNKKLSPLVTLAKNDQEKKLSPLVSLAEKAKKTKTFTVGNLGQK